MTAISSEDGQENEENPFTFAEQNGCLSSIPQSLFSIFFLTTIKMH
jgi:hypothetical protein